MTIPIRGQGVGIDPPDSQQNTQVRCINIVSTLSSDIMNNNYGRNYRLPYIPFVMVYNSYRINIL